MRCTTVAERGEQMRKKGIRKYIPWLVLAAVAALLAMMPVLARSAVSANEASVLTATAESGTIETTLAGGGTLTAEKAIEVKLPDQVEIEEFLVENGDHVEAGQALARVDRVTLLGTLIEIQDSMNKVAEEMRLEANNTSIVKLTSQASGRVKAIYAKVGDDARQVTLEHGALAVVSLDGMMMTELETDVPVRMGQGLTLKFSDGRELPGRVESSLNGRLTVTLTDDGPQLGETVTAYADDGTEVGSGVLAVHNAWNLLATEGTVNYVYVRENQKVLLGSGIVTVENPGGSMEYQKLAAKHREYEDLMQELFALYQDDTLKASQTGFVTGIDEKKAKNMAAGDATYRLEFLAAEETAPGPAILLVTGVNGNIISGIPYTADIDPTDLTGLLSLLSGGTTSVTITEGAIPSIGDIVSVTSTEEKTVAETINHIDIESIINGVSDTAKKVEEAMQMPQIPSFDLSGLDLSGLLGGFSMPQIAVGEEEEDDLFSLDQATVLSIIPDNAMTVRISVDELDILEYQLGMEADVTVDALPDHRFTAEVTEIGGVGENSGGSSKFRVELRLDRAPDMLDGMNASVVVHRGEKTALLLPVEAVYDVGSRSYVYTALDRKTGKPIQECTVTTGISDGKNVEILGGLTEGQPVYYEYYLPPENSMQGN